MPLLIAIGHYSAMAHNIVPTRGPLPNVIFANSFKRSCTILIGFKLEIRVIIFHSEDKIKKNKNGHPPLGQPITEKFSSLRPFIQNNAKQKLRHDAMAPLHDRVQTSSAQAAQQSKTKTKLFTSKTRAMLHHSNN